MFDKSSGQFNLCSYRHWLIVVPGLACWQYNMGDSTCVHSAYRLIRGALSAPLVMRQQPKYNYTQVNKGSFCTDGNAAPVEKAKFAFELAEPILYYMNDLNTRPTFVSGDRSGAYV